MSEAASALLPITASLFMVVAAAAPVVLLATVVGLASWFYWRRSARVMRGLAPAAPDFGDAFPCCTPPDILTGACLVAAVAFSFYTISLF